MKYYALAKTLNSLNAKHIGIRKQAETRRYCRAPVHKCYYVVLLKITVIIVADLPQQVRRDQPEQDRQAGERLRQEVPAPQKEAETILQPGSQLLILEHRDHSFWSSNTGITASGPRTRGYQRV